MKTFRSKMRVNFTFETEYDLNCLPENNFEMFDLMETRLTDGTLAPKRSKL